MPFVSPTLLAVSSGPSRSLTTYTTTNYTPTTYSPGRFNLGWVITYNNSSNFLTFTVPNFTFNNTTAWTVEFWVNIAIGSEQYRLLTIGDIDLYFLGSAQNTFQLRRNSSILHNIQLPSQNTWYHFGIVCDGTNWTSFINGIIQPSYSTSISNTSQVILGRNSVINPNINASLRVDELRISNVARYPIGFSYTVPTAAFTNDINTLGLFHFDDTTNADDNG